MKGRYFNNMQLLCATAAHDDVAKLLYYSYQLQLNNLLRIIVQIQYTYKFLHRLAKRIRVLR